MDTNLELDITREGNTFKIEAVTPHGKGTGFFELDPSLNSKMYDIQDCVEEQKLLDKKFVEEMGTHLFETLFSPIEKLFHECLDRSDHVTINLNARDFEIIKLPWELCYDPDYHLFLGADPRCSFVRRDERSETSPPSVNYPLKRLSHNSFLRIHSVSLWGILPWALPWSCTPLSALSVSLLPFSS